MMDYSRRKFLKTAVATLGCSSVSPALFGRMRQEVEPHFLIVLRFNGGWDSSYLFDPRPLEFTRKGKIQNYTNKEPVNWVSNSLASPLVEPLQGYKDIFSIVNGVHMAVGFDGHDQNLNSLFTGNPFGGASFVPHLNSSSLKTPLDYLQIGELFGLASSNQSAVVNLSPGAAASFSQVLQSQSTLSEDDPTIAYVKSRLSQPGNGKFSKGMRQQKSGINESFGLAEKIKATEFNTEEQKPEILKALELAHQYFLNGITHAAVIDKNDFRLDTHSSSEAKNQPEMYQQIVSEIKIVMQYLSETKFSSFSDDSLLDKTTFVITSEFGRTNCQMGWPIDATGTDHNPLGNTFLIGGKGVKGGQVIGKTDLDILDQNDEYLNVSGAHLQWDANLLSRMGKPFDFDTQLTMNVKPQSYNPDHYITIASVVNTIYKLYGLDSSYLWKNTRNGLSAKTLDRLLV